MRGWSRRCLQSPGTLQLQGLFFFSRNIQRLLLRGGAPGASWEDATLEGLTLGTHIGPQAGCGKQAGDSPPPCLLQNWLPKFLADESQSTVAKHGQHQQLQSLFRCLLPHRPYSNSMRKEPKVGLCFFSHFFQLFCLATLLHISSK